ncbi:threonine synthase [candidate division KSB1 bacterium]|nr:threonine synthase [candidate division KSB1 bacterium]
MQIRYQCIECGRKYETNSNIMYVCPVCSAFQNPKEPMHGVLRLLLPYDQLKTQIDQFSFSPDELMPVDRQFMPNYPVGNTPLFKSDRIAKELGFENLYFKDDSKCPTGSSKDRASLLVAGFAVKNNESKVVLASTGNIAASMAGVSAAANLKCITFVPATISKAKLAQIMIYGAQVVLIDGSYDDGYELAIEYMLKYGGICRNTAYNPLTIEGMKTLSLEIYKQLDYSVPDYIFVPCGDGTMLSGIYKGFYDMFQFDWFGEMPKLVAVQAEGYDAIVNGFTTGVIKNSAEKQTIADSLSVKIPRNAFLALKALESTCGLGVTVSNEEIRSAQHYLARTIGIFVEPAAAASFAGFRKLKNKIDNNAKIVLILSACGLKDIDSISQNIRIPDPVSPKLSSLPEELRT